MPDERPGPEQASPVTKARVNALMAVVWTGGGVAVAAADPDLPQLEFAKTAINPTILVAMAAIVVGFVFMTAAFDATDRV